MRLPAGFAIVVAAALLGCAGPEATTISVPPAAPGEPPPARPAPRKPAQTAHAPAVVMLDGGCEGIKAAHGTPDITMGAHAAVLNNGRYLTACGTPTTTAVKVCAAIRDGRARGVTVTTTPADEAVATCIARAIQSLSFPASPRLDITTVVFAAQ